MRSGIILTLIFVFSACLVRADSPIDHNAFQQQKLEAIGLAGTPWEEAAPLDEERSRAWMDALHHAYEGVLNLPLMEGKLVRHVLQTNSALKDRLGMVLLSAPKTFFQTDNTGLIRCRVEVPLSGKLSLRSALYLAALRPQSQQPVSFLASWSAGLPEVRLPVPDCRKLVVDVRKHYFEPSIFPRIFDSSGALLFQEAQIPQPQRFSRPAIKFATDVVKAREGLAEGEYRYVNAAVHELAFRDITVYDADLDVVSAFCNQLIAHPDRELDIVIVYDPHRQRSGGKLTAVKKKDKTETKDKPEKPGTNIPAGGKK